MILTSRRIFHLFPRLFASTADDVATNVIQTGDGFRPKLALAGASNWARNNYSSGDAKTGPCGFLHWAQAMTFCPFDVVSYGSVGGRTMGVILANFDAEITPFDPDIVLIGGDGIANAINNGQSATSIMTDLQGVIDKVIALDAIPVISTCPPNAGIDATSEATEWHKVNDAVRDLCRSDRRYMLLPIDEFTVSMLAASNWPNTTTGTGPASTAWTHDGTHFQPRNAIKVGRGFADIIQYRLGARTLKLPQTNSHPHKGVTNVCNIGTGGTLSGGASGAVSANCTLNGAAVGSKVARTDFQNDGEWQKIVATAAAGSTTFIFSGASIPTNMVAGQTPVWAVVEIMLNAAPTNLRGFNIDLSFTPNSNVYTGFNTSEGGGFASYGDAGPYIPTGVAMLYFTPIGLMPANATSCTITVTATKSSTGNLSADFHIGRAQVLTASAVPFNGQSLVSP